MFIYKCQAHCHGVVTSRTSSVPMSSIAVAGNSSPVGFNQIQQIPPMAYSKRPAVQAFKKISPHNRAFAAYQPHHTTQSISRQKASEHSLIKFPFKPPGTNFSFTSRRISISMLHEIMRKKSGYSGVSSLSTQIRTKRNAAKIYQITNVASSPAGSAPLIRTARGHPQAPFIRYPARIAPGYRASSAHGYHPGGGQVIAPPPPIPGAPSPMLQPISADPCAHCPGAGAPDDPMAFLKGLAENLDMRKLNNIYLSIQLLSTQATLNDFTVNLSGEFSENGQGGTPFGAFLTSFPYSYDNHMAEFILSDYTINTLFYQLHRKQFLTFRIGPETPKIGELLKTTCSEDEGDELEGTEVELDEKEEQRRLKKALIKLKSLRIRRSAKERGKRQDAGGLADLGICFGDILPAVREKYPNQKIVIIIRTARAPSVILSQDQGGTVILDIVADADIYIDGTNNRVGTITIATTIVVVVQLHGNRLAGTATISNLKLTDNTGSLGLPQDALDNLGNLGKELMQKLLNDALQKGVQINIPSGGLGGLPINIVNPTFRIIEHGLYIATDLTVSPALLGITGHC
ncbi:LBP / BPI / CETP family protein [Dictyocaulus viviparus]|uniref:LBP / BPI / CETP family protein n=1 Tax=Dictyocaulus viviparus TaxID=29172 RepID=A0A0D8XBK7_DICVI|nr:LBP / BPI / CETP family protein [Dictyocaulus viviparus]